MTRAEFTNATKRLIADRAGHQCSFPTCGRRTVGPGASAGSKSGTGKACHIFAAAPGGPRGQRGLTEEELKRPENGIWLCSDHATVVDNEGGSPFSPETLLSYKALQENRIVREVQGLFAPIGWVHKLDFLEGPVFRRNQSVTLAKLNLFFGENGAGKTALTDWIQGPFNLPHIFRWSSARDLPLRYQVTYLDPHPKVLDCTLTATGDVDFLFDGKPLPFIPPLMKVFQLGRISRAHRPDDLEWLSRVLSLDPSIVRNLVEEIHSFPHSHIRNLRWAEDEGRIVLILDSDGSPPQLSLGALSGREIERVLLEFITAAARATGRYFPTLLVLDGCPTIFFKGLFEFYSHHLLDPGNQFQTIMCIPTQSLDLNAVQWSGWEVVRFQSEMRGVTTVSQALRSQ